MIAPTLSHAAQAGRTCRLETGALPADPDAAMRWAWRELGIVADWSPLLKEGTDGMCYTVARNGTRGRVFLAPHAAFPRFTLAHEIGHLMLSNGAAFYLSCRTHLMRLPEQEANAFATTFLVPDEEVGECFEEGWTLPAIAGRFGVPEAAILARIELARLLGECRPSRLERLLSRLRPGDGD